MYQLLIIRCTRCNDNDYEDNKNSIPSRDKLTYKNGYYVNVTAIFIDIVDSSKLTDGNKRPTLAKCIEHFVRMCSNYEFMGNV